MTTSTNNWIAALDSTDLEDDEALCVELAGKRIAIYKTEGCYYASDDRCPHGNASLSEGWLEDGKIECPLHQSVFELKTGKVLNPPCKVDVQIYPIEIRDNMVFVNLMD